MRTIPRNHKKVIAAIKERVTQCRSYTLENEYSFARLIENDNGTWTVRVHDNCWYELAEGNQ